MVRASWYQWLLGKSRVPRRGQPLRGGARCHRPRLERLEDRTLLSTWTSEILTQGPGDEGSFSEQSDAGHPSYLNGWQSHGTVQGDSGITTVINVAHTSTATASDNPAEHGAISIIDFGFDVTNFAGSVQAGILLRQASNYYFGGLAAVQGQPWQHQTRSLSAGSFTLIGNPQAHPDFSTSGAPVSFGLFTSSTGAPHLHVDRHRECEYDPDLGRNRCWWVTETYWAPQAVNYGLDNFSVAIHRAATSLSVAAPIAPVAGTPFTVTVIAVDGNNNRDYWYHGKVQFSSTDEGATTDLGVTLPTDYTFTTGPSSAFDNGMHVFGVILRHRLGRDGVENPTITVTDPAIRQGYAIEYLIPDVATSLDVDVQTILDAGVARDITVTARDQFNNIATGYDGTVRVTSSDTTATLPNPDPYTFADADHGRHSWHVPNGITLYAAGPQSITAVDTGNPLLSPPIGVFVVPGVAVKFMIDNVPPTLVADAASDVRAVALDAYGPRDGNTATGYRGTVHFTSSDGAATLPNDYRFNDNEEYPGSHLFRNGLILRTPGDQTVTVTDTVTGITGTIHVTVTAAPAFAGRGGGATGGDETNPLVDSPPETAASWLVAPSGLSTPTATDGASPTESVGHPLDHASVHRFFAETFRATQHTQLPPTQHHPLGLAEDGWLGLFGADSPDLFSRN